MTFKERMNLWFYKNECIRIILVDETKRMRSFIKRLAYNERVIDMGGESYTIDPNKIHMYEGLPTLTYHISNTVALDLQNGKSEEYTSTTMNKIFKSKIVGELIDTSEDDGMSIKNIVLVASGVVVVLLGIGLYFLYQEIQGINEYIEQNKDVIDLIKDYLLRNGG